MTPHDAIDVLLWAYGIIATALLVVAHRRGRTFKARAEAMETRVRRAQQSRSAIAAQLESSEHKVDALRCRSTSDDGTRCVKPRGHVGEHETFVRSWPNRGDRWDDPDPAFDVKAFESEAPAPLKCSKCGLEFPGATVEDARGAGVIIGQVTERTSGFRRRVFFFCWVCDRTNNARGEIDLDDFKPVKDWHAVPRPENWPSEAKS